MFLTFLYNIFFIFLETRGVRVIKKLIPNMVSADKDTKGLAKDVKNAKKNCQNIFFFY